MRKDRERSIVRVTLQGSVVNFLLLLLKFIFGILGNSAALVADAVHSLSDFITDLIVLIFVKVANKPEDDGHDYGHGKFETLATLLIGVILLGVGVGIFYSGAKTIYLFFTGVALVKPHTVAFWIAILSIISKELLYQYTLRVGKTINSPVVIANAWHHRSDAFSSIGTSIGIGGAIFLGEKWVVLDPIAAVVVSIFIVKAAYEILKSTLDELLERSLSPATEKKIMELVAHAVPQGKLNGLKTRKIGSYYAIEFILQMDAQLSLEEAHDVTVVVERVLRKEFGEETHIGIHVEPK